MSRDAKPLEFVTLWSAHSRQVYSYIYSLIPDCNDADDIFQETTITLLEKFAEFDPASSFSAWACRVAYYKSLSFLKSRPKFEFLDDKLLDALEPLMRQSAFESDGRFDALGHCMSLLPPDDRKMVQLRYIQELSVKEVAERMGRDRSGIYKSLSRIHDVLLNCIRQKLAEEGHS